MLAPSDGLADLRLCSVADLAEQLEPDSVDLILTDPPYPREYLPTWGDLGVLAAKVLKPGGALVAMTGHGYLPEVCKLLEQPGLEYQWTISYQLGGATARMWKPKVFQWWKPILWYSKGPPRHPAGFITDRILATGRDKRFHHWGQDLGTFSELCEKFSPIGALVCDPFLGGGTTAAAAILNSRRFLGCDIDPACIETTNARLRAVEDYLQAQRARVGAGQSEATPQP